jgi:hypothetical protein
LRGGLPIVPLNVAKIDRLGSLENHHATTNEMYKLNCCALRSQSPAEIRDINLGSTLAQLFDFANAIVYR